MKGLIATLVLLSLDALWIYLYMAQQYERQVKNIQGTPMVAQMHYAALAYLLMVVGLNLFVLPNIREGHEFTDSLLYGGMFGLVVYGIYDFTSAAVLSNWDINLAIVDVLWGSFVFFAAAYAGAKLGPMFSVNGMEMTNEK